MKCRSCGSDNSDDSRFCGRCGSPLVEAPTTPPSATTRRMSNKTPIEFAPGQHFGTRYQIVEEIGRGGMGVVYKAIDRELDRVVALKMIRPELSSDPEMVKQFKQELILASEISHDNVIRIHDLGEAHGIKYISMKYIDGTSLADLVKATGRLTPDKAVSVGRQICMALSAAHKKGVIHRDLKPHNIMIDRYGDAQVMDFGIARSLTAKEVTARGIVTGTPHYLSPEQAGGGSGDERSDIYSLGCILYQVVTGRKPFEADTVEGLLQHHLHENPVPPSEINQAIPKSLEDAILRAMEKDPRKRFRSAEDLLGTLGKVQERLEARVEGSKPSVTDIRAEPEASIAVLPFRDMSPQKDQEYFCDGMAEEIINALVRIEGLRVAALTSAFQFKNKAFDVRTIGDKLSVGAVLEGSVRKAGNRLRVTAQLVNVADGYHIWSERYDRDMEDVFAIQDDISEAIVKALAPRLVVRKPKSAAQRSQNLEVYNLYLRGRYHWNKRIPPEIRKAIEYFNKALELDPEYALAYAGLADCYLLLDRTPPKEIYAKARAAATRALELESTLAEPHTTLAWVAVNSEYDWDTAEMEFKKSLELNPNYATGHQWYAIYLMARTRFEDAFLEIERAKELDPLSPIIKTAAGWIRCCARQYDRALEEVRGALDMDPDFMPAHSILAEVYKGKGMSEESLMATKAMLDRLGYHDMADAMERAYRESGLRTALEFLLDRLSGGEPFGEFVDHAIAELLVELGRYDEAFTHLERAYARRESEFPLFSVMPPFDPLRSDPRFQDLLRRIGLKPESQ
jgi:serine/threonine protein kinase/tetratricopeptide (TPR) repeat protein